MSEEVRIDLVSDDDAGELLTVRRAAFVAEAQLYGDPNLPSLTQTLSEVQEDLQRPDVVTIGAWDGPRLIGAVRLGVEAGRAPRGRLSVVPDRQGEGVGTKLLPAVLQSLREATKEVGVFTGQDSKHNLAMYGKHGFEHLYCQKA